MNVKNRSPPSRLLKNKPLNDRTRDLSTSVVLDFEGIGDFNPVGSFYNGAGGPNYGIEFGTAAFGMVDSDEGGTAYIANEPSPSTVLFLLDDNEPEVDPTITVTAGFSEMSFQYVASYDGSITVYDGPGCTGAVLAKNVTFPRTGLCDDYGVPECGDPTGTYGVWRQFSVPFPGVAKSVRFNQVIRELFIDDMTFVSKKKKKSTKQQKAKKAQKKKKGEREPKRRERHMR